MSRIMQTGYTVQPINPDRIDQAYPLVQVVAPALDLEGWRRSCRAAIAAAGAAQPRQPDAEAILLVVNERGYIHGLCVYTMTTSEEPRLNASTFIVMSAVDQAGACAALVCGLMAVGRNHGCVELRIDSTRADSWTTAFLEEWGFRATGRSLSLRPEAARRSR